MTTVALYSCFALIIFTCMCVVQGNTSVKYRARKNLKLPENKVDKTIATNGLIMCVSLCKSETAFQCVTASWGNGSCLLSETIAIHTSRKLEENAAWTTMCRIVYPVFCVRGELGRYTLTFEAAKIKCEEHGSRVATRQELLDAWAMGFEYCTCGWLSDETKGYVMQIKRRGCGMKNKGIITSGCDSRSDVYCVA